MGGTVYAPLAQSGERGSDVGRWSVVEKWRRLHVNCKVISVYGFLFHFGWSTWERNLFPVYVAETAGTADVGYVQSVQGLAALVAAPALAAWMDATGLVGIRAFVVCWGLASLGGVFLAVGQARPAPVYVAMAAWGVLLTAQGVFTDTALASSSRAALNFTRTSTFLMGKRTLGTCETPPTRRAGRVPERTGSLRSSRNRLCGAWATSPGRR